MITNINDGFMELAESFIDGMFHLFYDLFVMGLMAGVRDILVGVFCGDVFGLSMVTIAFLMVLIIGMVIAIKSWGGR